MNPIDANAKNSKQENDVALPGHWLSPDGIQPLPKRETAAVPADTAHEAVHEVMSKRAAQDITPVPGSTSLHAAKGDDDLMSKPPAVSKRRGKGDS